ncbi:hypothetical protein H5410_018018 [Solanum commersonii]|uniref:Secreted protein n=1 Tax=Solanum commersonii TaxID=4109 RepID=A0A9J6A1M5_SOLCO|nr:hypothetical protein H5410_018018 [Solanum commersonii]
MYIIRVLFLCIILARRILGEKWLKFNHMLICVDLVICAYVYGSPGADPPYTSADTASSKKILYYNFYI